MAGRDVMADRIAKGEEAARNGILAGMRGALGALGRFWVAYGMWAGALVLIAFVASVMAIGWLRPVHAWDMVAYLGAALKPEFPDPQALHGHVWETVRLAATPDHFLQLSEGDAYRTRQFTDPHAFHSMLGMYEVKWLYVKLLAVLLPLTGPVHAAFAINLGAAVAFTGVLLWWLRSVRMLNLAPLVVILLVLARFPALAMAESPDFLTSVFVLAGLMALDRDKILAGCAALVLAVATRPDNIVLIAGLAGAFWLWKQRAWPWLLGALGAGFLAYAGIQAVSDHPGWWPHLWFSTYQIQETMEFFQPDFSVRVYLTGFAWNLVRAAFENSWLGLYAGGLCVWALAHAGGLRFGPARTALIGAALGAIALKFMIFPLHDGRTYFPILFPALLLMLAELRDRARLRAGAVDG